MLVHTYGVVAADAVVPEDLTGRAGAEVRQVADDDLAVIVSDVEDEARVGRDDLMAHAHLLEALAGVVTVVPMRFGVLMPDDETVRRELLGHQHDHLLSLLHAFDGTVQLTVRATYREEAAMREVVEQHPDLKRRVEGLSSQIELGEKVAAALELLRRRDESMLIDRISAHALAVAVTEPTSALEVLNVALLVERAKQRNLDEAVALLRENVQDRMELRYVGPQAPFAFLDSVTTATEERTWG